LIYGYEESVLKIWCEEDDDVFLIFQSVHSGLSEVYVALLCNGVPFFESTQLDHSVGEVVLGGGLGDVDSLPNIRRRSS